MIITNTGHRIKIFSYAVAFYHAIFNEKIYFCKLKSVKNVEFIEKNRKKTVMLLKFGMFTADSICDVIETDQTQGESR